MRTLMSTVTLAAALVTTAATAHAQPGLAPVFRPAAPRVEPAELKSPATATMLSLAGAVAPVVLVAAGEANGSDDLVGAGMLASTLTPSLGHWYAGRFLTTGMAARGVGTLLVFTGAMQGLSSAFDGGGEADDGAALMVLGALTYVGGTVYDVATAGEAARAYNRSHATHLAVAPTMIPAGGGALAMGMGVSGAF